MNFTSLLKTSILVTTLVSCVPHVAAMKKRPIDAVSTDQQGQRSGQITPVPALVSSNQAEQPSKRKKKDEAPSTSSSSASSAAKSLQPRPMTIALMPQPQPMPEPRITPVPEAQRIEEIKTIINLHLPTFTTKLVTDPKVIKDIINDILYEEEKSHIQLSQIAMIKFVVKSDILDAYLRHKKVAKGVQKDLGPILNIMHNITNKFHNFFDSIGIKATSTPTSSTVTAASPSTATITTSIDSTGSSKSEPTTKVKKSQEERGKEITGIIKTNLSTFIQSKIPPLNTIVENILCFEEGQQELFPGHYPHTSKFEIIKRAVDAIPNAPIIATSISSSSIKRAVQNIPQERSYQKKLFDILKEDTKAYENKAYWVSDQDFDIEDCFANEAKKWLIACMHPYIKKANEETFPFFIGDPPRDIEASVLIASLRGIYQYYRIRSKDLGDEQTFDKLKILPAIIKTLNVSNTDITDIELLELLCLPALKNLKELGSENCQKLTLSIDMINAWKSGVNCVNRKLKTATLSEQLKGSAIDQTLQNAGIQITYVK